MASAKLHLQASRAPAPASNSGQILSTDDIRAQFPALQRIHGDQSVAYFDGPGGTQVPRVVVETMAEHLLHHNANTHWNYPTSAETDAMLETARATLAIFLGGAPDEIVFGANATTLAFRVSRTLGRRFDSNDELVITELDHHANVGPWQALAQERGCPLRIAKMDPATGTLDWGHFDQQVNRQTRLIALGAASNALGTINDVRRAAQLARAVGALVFVDAVHFAPHHLVDVREIDCDFLVCSAYKFYGPHMGALWCRRDLLESLPFPKLTPAPDRAPDRAETGTLNHEGIAGAAAAVDFLASLATNTAHSAGREAEAADCPDTRRPNMRQHLSAALGGLQERCAALTQAMWHGLARIDGVTLYGPPPEAPRTPTIAFTVRGVPSSEVAGRLAERGVFVSHGNFYAATVVERLALGSEGLVRAGCACYTTAVEVERLVAGVGEIVRCSG